MPMIGLDQNTRPRRYSFTLTPLADVMFQLLIFFMLSTSLTPYSLTVLRSSQKEAPQDQAQDDAVNPNLPGPGQAPQQEQAVWVLRDATLTTSGQTYDIEQISDVADVLGQADASQRVTVVVMGTARMQDLASALEALRVAGITRVSVVKGGP